jgi:hypothetical protein
MRSCDAGTWIDRSEQAGALDRRADGGGSLRAVFTGAGPGWKRLLNKAPAGARSVRSTTISVVPEQ